METATNAKTGERVAFIGGAWKPVAETATNPKTGQKAYLVEGAWHVAGPPGPGPAARGIAERTKVSAAAPLLSAVQSVAIPLTLGAAQGVSDVAGSVAGGFGDMLSRGGASGVPGLGRAGAAISDAAGGAMAGLERFLAPIKAESPIAAGLGRTGGQLVATAPLLGGTAGAIRAAGAVPGLGRAANALAEAVASGGFRGGNALTRAAGGAIGGAVASKAVGGDATGGAMIGAAVPVVGAKLVGVGTGMAEWLARLATGKGGKDQAAELAADALGPQLEAALAALKAAPAGADPRRVLAEAGIDADPFMAMGEFARRKDVSSQFRKMAERETAVQRGMISDVAMGENQTAARTSAVAAKGGLNARTGAMREEALGQADEGGALDVDGIRESIADRLADPALSKFDVTRDVLTSFNAALEHVRGGKIAKRTLYEISSKTLNEMTRRHTGWSPFPPPEARVKLAEAKLAEAKKIIDDTANAFSSDPKGNYIKDVRENMDAHGIREAIAKKVRDPEHGVSDVSRAALSKVSKKLEEWTNKNTGIIPAQALYEIRKTTVNEVVQKLIGGLSPKLSAKRAADVLAQINPLIDDAIISAGGAGWKDYLRKFEAGSKEINRAEMAAKALKMFDTNPKKFVDLVRGGDPKAVEKTFGPGSYDFAKEMADKFAPLLGAAERAETGLRVAEQAKAGMGGWQAILEADRKWPRIPGLLNAKATIANAALNALEDHVSKSATRAVVDGFKSSKNMMDILARVPSRERTKVLKLLRQSEDWNSAVSRAAVVAAEGGD